MTVMVGLRGGCRCRGAVRFRPRLGNNVFDLPVGQRKPGEHVAQTSIRIDVAAAATLDQV